MMDQLEIEEKQLKESRVRAVLEDMRRVIQLGTPLFPEGYRPQHKVYLEAGGRYAAAQIQACGGWLKLCALAGFPRASVDAPRRRKRLLPPVYSGDGVVAEVRRVGELLRIKSGEPFRYQAYRDGGGMYFSSALLRELGGWARIVESAGFSGDGKRWSRRPVVEVINPVDVKRVWDGIIQKEKEQTKQSPWVRAAQARRRIREKKLRPGLADVLEDISRIVRESGASSPLEMRFEDYRALGGRYGFADIYSVGGWTYLRTQAKAA